MARHPGTDQDLLAIALVGYEAQIAKINAAIRGIQAQLGHRGSKAATDGATPAKRVLSAAARKSIGDVARKRWAAIRKAAAKKAKPVAKAATAGA